MMGNQSKSKSGPGSNAMGLGHEKLDVYRLSIGYVAWVYEKAENSVPYGTKPEKVDPDPGPDFDFEKEKPRQGGGGDGIPPPHR